MLKNTLHLFFLVVLFVFLQGCRETKDIFTSSVMGEIVNPQTSYIKLLKNNKVIDTVPLDQKNRFFYHFENYEPGFYTFRHNYDTHYESQMFYVEPGDSLQFRLNTQDFDNSLMYSGRGAAKNNLLMTLFNENRNNNRYLIGAYGQNPSEFIAKVDSVQSGQYEKLELLTHNQSVTEEFYKVAQSLIKLAKFRLYERYYFYINRNYPELKKQLPEDFLAYRSSVNYNDDALQTYYTYQYFLDDYLRNRTIEECLKKQNTQACYELDREENLELRLQLANSIFHLSSLRSLFLTRYTGRLIVQSKSIEKIDSWIQFLERAEDYGSTELNMVKELADVHKKQFIGNINDLYLSPTDNDEVKIHTLLTKPTVFYYWSAMYTSHHLTQHEKIEKLRKQFPKLQFIGINIDTDNPEKWLSVMRTYQYNSAMEFQVICSPKEREFFRNYLNKLVLVDQSGEVVQNNLTVNQSDLEQLLVQFSESKK